MISVQEAQERVMAQAIPLGTEERELKTALGLVLAEPIVASISLPPFDNSAMDGYAVRSQDLASATSQVPGRLILVGEVAAGSVREEALHPWQAVQIMTGAPLPPGADTVVILEEARRRDGCVTVDHPVPKGAHIRRQGEDVERGRTVIPAGKKIRSAEMALLVSLGQTRVKIFPPPKVAILATGSELIGADQELRPGTIRDSNTWLLAGYLESMGVPALNIGIVPDDVPSIVDAFRRASDCDLILSSGGVSVGEHDLVKRVLLKEFDFKTIFWRVRMKPGKPLLFGRFNGKLFFGLPGNPISCAVCFIQFIAPALRKMMGYPNPDPVTLWAALTSSLSFREAEKTLFLTARLELDSMPPKVTPTTRQGSGMLTSMTEGNALIVVPEGVKELPAETLVEVIPDV